MSAEIPSPSPTEKGAIVGEWRTKGGRRIRGLRRAPVRVGTSVTESSSDENGRLLTSVTSTVTAPTRLEIKTEITDNEWQGTGELTDVYHRGILETSTGPEEITLTGL